MIDGIQTLMNKNDYTVSNEIFRFLSSKVDENFEILVLTFSDEDKFKAYEFFPECLYKNIIFYNHTQTLSFNWRSYDNLSIEFIEDVKSKLILPEGINITVGK